MAFATLTHSFNALLKAAIARASKTRLQAAASLLPLATTVLIIKVAQAQPLIPFTEEAVGRGLVYQMQNYFQTGGLLGFGCGFADLDNDGDQDVILLGAHFVERFVPIGRVGIFENDGTGHFIDRSINNGIALMPEGVGFAAADYDGDGLIDLYITQMSFDVHPSRLYRNLGNFQFEDTSAAAGVELLAPAQAPAWGDYNNDGWVDLHVPTYHMAYGSGSWSSNGVLDKLYRNNGDGTFTDVAPAQGVDNNGYGFQSVWFDYDRDGDVDLYLSQDRGHLGPYFQSNKLWRNDDGVLVNVSAESGADEALFSMGIACGDFDGNRWPDIYVTNLAGYINGYNRLLLNQGNGTFLESAAAAGVDHWVTSWGAIFFDFSNDGIQDLYVNNQFVDNTMYHNAGAFPCEAVTTELDCGGNDGTSWASAVGDIDNDGDLDLLVNSLSFNVELFVNHHADSGERRWLEYVVVGQPPNTKAIGASLDTRIGQYWQWREIMAGGNGYLGQNDLTVHVGADTVLAADEVVVSWPGGKTVRTLTNVPTNQRWTMWPPERLGDADGNGLVTLSDFWAFVGCHGRGVEPGCEIMDFDGNWQIDDIDFYAFTGVYDDPIEDCDRDGVIDLAEILGERSLDGDQNGVLDECEEAGVPGDVTGDGLVNVFDLLAVISAWGPCPQPQNCPADLTGDGTVNVADLLFVIGHWG